MEESERLFFNPASVRKLTSEEQIDLLNKIHGLEVVDAKTEKSLALEAFWQAICQYKVTLLEQRAPSLRGWQIVLVGLGTPKTALKYTAHLGLSARIVVDQSLTTYNAMGWDKGAGLATAKTSKEAADRLKACATCPDASTFLIGGGITHANQNGGYLAVAKDGKTIPFLFHQSEAGDLPDLDVLTKALVPQ